jgi:uncharacterized RDD family membrane protein YckC/Tfp pilus assembly protein PilE
MEEDRTWSVSVTGKTLAGFNPQTVWQHAAAMMKFEADAFRERVLERAPLTLKAVSQADACRQRDALIDCGAEAVALDNPRGRYLWLQLDGKVRGPVSEAYARNAVDKGALSRQTHACIKGEAAWQPLEKLLGWQAPPAPVDDVAAGMSFSAWDTSAAGESMDGAGSGFSSRPNANANAKLPDNMASVYGGFWMRLAALLIDTLILCALLFAIIIGLVLSGAFGTASNGKEPQETLVLLCIASVFVVPWLYFALFESSTRQATPGKLALGLRVTDENGRRVSFGRALGRNLGRYLSQLFFYLGYLMAGWTSRKQAMHDLIAGTFVVNRSGMEAWRQDRPMRKATGMPAWAVVVIIVVGGFFTAVPVLAAIAIPAYQQYLLRVQTTEAVLLTEPARTAVAHALLNGSGMPVDNTQAGLASPDDIHGKYVSSVEIANGDIVARFGSGANPALQNKHITFVASLGDGRVSWRCDAYGIQEVDLPPACRTQ